MLPLRQTATAAELTVVGTKHFALGVEDIEKVKEFIIKNKIKNNVEILMGKMGKHYFFINDPDGILVEIIENN